MCLETYMATFFFFFWKWLLIGALQIKKNCLIWCFYVMSCASAPSLWAPPLSTWFLPFFLSVFLFDRLPRSSWNSQPLTPVTGSRMSSSSSKHNTTGAKQKPPYAYRHIHTGKEEGTYGCLISVAHCNNEYISWLYKCHLVLFFIENIRTMLNCWDELQYGCKNLSRFRQKLIFMCTGNSTSLTITW